MKICECLAEPEHVFPWDILCSRNTFILLIIKFQISKRLVCGRTDSKYTSPLYLRSWINLTTVGQLETSGLCKTLQIFAACMGMLEILFLILENSTLPCFIAILLNKILLQIMTFYNYFKCFNWSGIRSRAFPLQSAWHGI